jgi:hypothetical protein
MGHHSYLSETYCKYPDLRKPWRKPMHLESEYKQFKQQMLEEIVALKNMTTKLTEENPRAGF